MKILCKFDDNQVQCRVIENMGYQGGDHVRAVEYKGEERIVVKRGKIWRPKTVAERTEPTKERFIMPTDEQKIEMAILFNNGELDVVVLAKMVGYMDIILDRLYENGVIDKPSSKESPQDR